MSADKSSEADRPALTALVVTPGDFGNIRRTVAALAAQTVASRVELLIVAPHEGIAEAAKGRLDAFHSVEIQVVGPIANVDHAVADHLLRARAPVVAPIEDHVFPEPEWAERLLEQWREGCDGVAPAVVNANPRRGLSWLNLLIAYGSWAENRPEGPHEAAPVHNGSFRRDSLAPLAANLRAGWNREGGVLREMKAKGATFRFAPRARIRHLNPSSLSSTAKLRFDAGRLYAANRAADEGWGLGKRGAYAALSPLIPVVRYVRMRKDLFAGSDLSEVKMGPWMFLGLVFDAAGQAAGYLKGAGGARDSLATFEMDRADHLSAADRREFYPGR